MRRLLIITGIIFCNYCLSQTISINDLFRITENYGFDSAINIIEPHELYYLDSTKSVKFAYSEFNYSFINRFKTNNKNIDKSYFDYPIYTIRLVDFAFDDTLGKYLFEYYNSLSITNHFSDNDTLYTIFGHGWFDDLLASLIICNPNGLTTKLTSDLTILDDSIRHLENHFPNPIARFFTYIFKGKPIIIDKYETLNYRALQIALAIEQIDHDLIGTEQKKLYRKNLPAWRKDYKFPIKTRLKNHESIFDSRNIELSSEFQSIVDLVKNDSILAKEIFGGVKLITGCYFQRPFVVKENSVLFWDRCHFDRFGLGTLYKLTLIDSRTVYIEEVEMYL